ncbi:MAG: phosphohydrolase, partial [Chitinophagales bacterium]|nr:phosphohydrolase [Chitinophagales bacterium]
MNKKKIFNDPVYGLIRFPFDSLYAIIDHAYFQRLRRISQQALSHYVYPGALHTRFQHAMGATFLMTKAIETLRAKDVEI